MEARGYKRKCGVGMIKFSLRHMLESSPYELILSGDSFVFQTDFGIHYSVSFNKEDIVLGECDTYQLIIRKIEERRSSYDPKVEKTILSIISEFFRLNLEVMLYMCDTSDGKEEVRNRLFLSWFEKYADKMRFTICKAHMEIEGEGLFICIIVDNRNPKLVAITEDFNEQAGLLTGGKP